MAKDRKREPRSLVQNASDARQVRNAGKEVRFNRENELEDLRVALGTPAGRRVFWRLLTMAGLTTTVLADGLEHVLVRAGRQEYGQEILGEIIEAGQDYYLKMQAEHHEELTRHG